RCPLPALPARRRRDGIHDHRSGGSAQPGGAGRPVTSACSARLRAFRSCPLITPKRARSSLQMLAMARAMAVLCASIGHVLTRCSDTLKKLSASESPPVRAGDPRTGGWHWAGMAALAGLGAVLARPLEPTLI